MERINQDIKTGQFNRLYLLYGDDEYFRTFARNKLKKALISDDDFMNYAEFTGKDVDINTIMDTARTIPFLGERRVIVVNDTGLFNLKGRKAQEKEENEDDADEASNTSSETDGSEAQTSQVIETNSGKKTKKQKEYGLNDFFAEIPDTTVLIFCEEKVNRGEKLFKAVEKNGVAIAFERIKENDAGGIKRLQGYVLQKLGREKKNITYGAMALFLDRTGTDLRKVFIELDKLIAYTLGRDSITEDDVKALIPEKIEDRVFDMIEFISSFQQRQALDLYYDLLRKKESPIKILSLIERHYNQLYIVKELSKTGMSSTDILKRAGIKPYDSLYKKYLGQARRYTTEDLRHAMEMCLDYDKAAKSGRIKDNIAVEMVIVAMSSRTRI